MMTPSIILSFVLTLCTIIYTGINYLLWQESIKTRRELSCPNLIAYLKFSEDHKSVELLIENIGNGVARDVKVVVLEDYDVVGYYALSSIGIVQNGFKSFPPKYKLKYPLNLREKVYAEGQKEYIKLEISYFHLFDKKLINHTETFDLSFTSISNQGYLNY